MAWASPTKFLGLTTAPEGSPVKCKPTPLPGGFGWVVAVSLTETAARDDLDENASAPPSTGKWLDKTLTKDIGFPIDERARGKIVQELPNGDVVVEFQFVAAIVGDADIE